MVGYSPLKITGMSAGLVQERENFLLPDDAYPILQNAYVWRERILRKRGYQLLGRLQRNIGTTDAGGNAIILIGGPLPLNTGISSFTVGNQIFTDPGGASPVNLLTNGPGTATLDRATGTLTIVASNALTAIQYFPGLPVMGLRTRELQNSANDQMIAFDQVYAYIFNSVTNQFQEFIPGTTWNAGNADVKGIDFFWSTNYWMGDPILTNPPAYVTAFTTRNKLFWVTNNSGHFGANADPPRITDGTTWVDFYHDTLPAVNSPWAQIDATNFLVNWMAMLPFRGRMVTFNTWEGTTAASAINYSNRIRWSRIGNPFIPFSAGPPATGSWRSDIRGQGGFLDIPTSEDIVAVGFVRDNLVIYCERSTWQLRYTGRSIAPFQIEKVNSELGAEGTFSAVQFDTSLVGIGDKGVVECDSYKSERIDIKIPDLVFQFQAQNNGPARVHGIRDFINRLAFWTFPLASDNGIFPDQRLVYNYENDSWALFNDSLTCLGTFQDLENRTWLNTEQPWIECNFAWIDQPFSDPLIVGGNQQGFVEVLDELTVNDISLYITNITGNNTTPTLVTSPNHNMKTGFVVKLTDIPSTDPFFNLNNQIFGIVVPPLSSDTFQLFKYDPSSEQFSDPQLDPSTNVFEGQGNIAIVENFSITSKKFNFLDEGQNIQLGYLDILMEATEPDEPGAISLFVYLNYDDSTVSNTLPENEIYTGVPPPAPDTFFNATIPTTQSTLSGIQGTKFWQRVFCPTRANFLTLKYTFSNAQMAGEEQTKNIQIDAQVLWIRKAGRMSQI